MPVYLKETYEFEKLERFENVLIIPCRFCPAASLAITENEPYFSFFRRLLQTAAYERYIARMKSELEKRGVPADVFRSRWLHQFVVCMWTRRRRAQLRNLAQRYDALVVLGCEAAVQTIKDSLDDLSIPVIQGMRTEGIMSILPRFQWPDRITLQINSITPLLHHQEEGTEPWMHLDPAEAPVCCNGFDIPNKEEISDGNKQDSERNGPGGKNGCSDRDRCGYGSELYPLLRTPV